MNLTENVTMVSTMNFKILLPQPIPLSGIWSMIENYEKNINDTHYEGDYYLYITANDKNELPAKFIKTHDTGKTPYILENQPAEVYIHLESKGVYTITCCTFATHAGWDTVTFQNCTRNSVWVKTIPYKRWEFEFECNHVNSDGQQETVYITMF